MPVAAVTIDVGDGNVTWKGREFARRCLLGGHYWGSSAKPWAKVRLIQGSRNAKAPELGPARTIDRDEDGKPVKPAVQEYSLGVHRLKELALERLAVTDGGPGQCYFAPGIARNHYEEYFNEPLIDGKFERQGPQESLDLFAYEEAARLMLRPDRKDIVWTSFDRRPPWARPVSLLPEGGDPHPPGGEAPVPVDTRRNTFERFGRLNQRSANG
jgi:phage terminase large subunit GpA-like protein